MRVARKVILGGPQGKTEPRSCETIGESGSEESLKLIALVLCLIITGFSVQAAETSEGRMAVDQGTKYEQGRGVPADFKTALKFYKQAAEKNEPGAERRIGNLYERGGPGLPQDYNEAMRWYLVSGRKGDVLAHTRVGRLHENGKGVPKNYDEALKWYSLAKEKGNLGDMGQEDIDRVKRRKASGK